MRIALYVALGLALASLQPAWAENVVACAAAIVLECLPYLVASELVTPRLRHRTPALLAYAGCGCGDGLSARSIPAAIATALIFGPLIAGVRIAIAALVARRFAGPVHEHHTTLAGAFVSLAPSALLAATAATIATNIGVAAQPTLVQLIAGLLLGACASPCALGGVALAASLHAVSPTAAYGALATTGFFDVRRWLPRGAPLKHDALAYGLLALASAIAGCNGGAHLVNPRLTIVFFACVPYFAISAIRTSGSTSISARVVAAALVIAVVIGAPPPTYRATETTLSDIFVGESLDFTGRYMQTNGSAFIERYAITCCRADAAPIALELTQPLRVGDGAWLQVLGTIAAIGGRNLLRVTHCRAITPPSDPFIYR